MFAWRRDGNATSATFWGAFRRQLQSAATTNYIKTYAYDSERIATSQTARTLEPWIPTDVDRCDQAIQWDVPSTAFNFGDVTVRSPT